MTTQHEKDAKALQALDELKTLKAELAEASNDLARLVGALRNPCNWRIKAEAPLGYGENNASDVKLPDLKALGEKVHEYQKRHYDLTIQSGLSQSVQKMIRSEIDRI